LFIAYPAANFSSAIFAPTVTMRRLGLSFHGKLSSPEAGGSGFAITGAFPLGNNKEARSSGWAWGIAAGLLPYSQDLPKLSSAGIYFWELMLGRGTVYSEAIERDTGLRGFMEFSLRNQRPHRNPEFN